MAAIPEVNSAKPVSSAFFRSPGRAATLATTVCILRTVWAACWPGVGGGGGGSPGGSGFGGGRIDRIAQPAPPAGEAGADIMCSSGQEVGWLVTHACAPWAFATAG